jgi:curved DNA-binding protein CbpA
MGELENAYRMLELEPGASMDEINQAYKDLVFIWHPDRLPNENLRLQEKAQEKIKHLNKARDYLRSQAKVGNPAVRARSSDRRASQAYTSARAYSTYHRPRTTTAATEARSDRSEERPSGQSSYYRSRQYYRPDPSQYQSYNNSRSYGNNSAASSTTNGNGAANGTGNGTASDRYRSASTSRAAAPSSPAMAATTTAIPGVGATQGKDLAVAPATVKRLPPTNRRPVHPVVLESRIQT